MLKKKKFSGGCEFFTNLSLDTIYLSPKLRENGLFFKTDNQRIFFNTVHNLIAFSIVFTNKNRGGAL